ncbi:geranylgeranyl transferase type-2 subunit alpha [Condylostylus longicornis]|uniref:geranylgeranyl transferase type-2 subunit alpha n=1 Tax=Condylostylus longicornis TaxID=2530218 RepID=UPI00244E3FFF|nr:geranylgeranyl transferase type-2 subunit alpha [Condylostylus longicornis]
MHGRLKVRTTAEEEAKKKKEQAIKAKAYLAGMEKIFKKRENNELDAEMLVLTGHILQKNPDVTTLWNIRRECFLAICDNDERNELYQKDLNFTEQCLKVNPKSYCAWHHRCWILENSTEPDWNKEVALCTKYLKMDERNFHCWDYRRYVVEKAKISPEKELEFCTDKIKNNFSNYSSWHYRSKLLPIVHPHPTEPTRPISEEILKEELEMVLTAAFTDPNDSSAWFYQRWLLGYSKPLLDISAFRVTKDKLVLSLTQSIDINEFTVTVGSIILESKNFRSARSEHQYDNVWILQESVDFSNLDSCLEVKCTSNDGKINLKINVKKVTDGYCGLRCPNFEYEFGAALKDQLRSQLMSCEELLEYEPESKWTLLTAALLMRAIDRRAYFEKSIENLAKLEIVDRLRVGYYKDLATKWKVEKKIEEWIENGDISKMIDLSNLKLSSLPYDYVFSIADSINLSNNCLQNRSLEKFYSFQFAKTLDLSSNLFKDDIETMLIKQLNNVEIKH